MRKRTYHPKKRKSHLSFLVIFSFVLVLLNEACQKKTTCYPTPSACAIRFVVALCEGDRETITQSMLPNTKTKVLSDWEDFYENLSVEKKATLKNTSFLFYNNVHAGEVKNNTIYEVHMEAKNRLTKSKIVVKMVKIGNCFYADWERSNLSSIFPR